MLKESEYVTYLHFVPGKVESGQVEGKDKKLKG